MQMKKTLMLLLALVLLVGAVAISGCVDDEPAANGTDNKTNETPSEPANVTPSEPTNVTPSEPTNVTPSEPANVSSGEKVVVQNQSEFDGTAKHLVVAKDRKFSVSSVNISKGETVRIWNREDVNFAHMYHSEEGAFPDTKVNIKYDVYFTFNEPGTYKIDIYNPNTGEPYPTNAVLTVKVS
ncbi:hypothetical protein [Methanolapillus ohkumae]|uniref:EfeO-type cupredoxin-like domain-containing protein n=1 Tax=Methanolapillus ohkumae TaxID=3028298 RepID=A0AA96V6M9_9EURY|nr:hypothetical protein MsAm2_09240 [Methanosarcinaceae archaeon Am2]